MRAGPGGVGRTEAVAMPSWSPVLAPEDQLLFECSRTVIDADGAVRAAALIDAGLDWNAVVRASIRHGVAPLLHRGLEQLRGGRAQAPSNASNVLARLYESNGRRADRLFSTLKKIVAALRTGGVEPVGLKDVQLAVQAYPDRALRPMGDIDLLIKREDWDKAARILEREGLLPRPSGDVPYGHKYSTGQHFRRAHDEVWIDLQWNVMQREWDMYGDGQFTYDGRGMWTRSVAMRLDGYELRVPTLEDMLFHLCLHLEGHNYSELVLFCDIAELLRRRGDELSWDLFSEITRFYSAGDSVYYVLFLTHGLLGADVPSEVFEQLKPSRFRGAGFAPMFGNLGALHGSLDELRLAARPKQPVIDELERVVRRQTARALTLQRHVDDIADRFRRDGGTVFALDGSAPPRLFPDPALPPFAPLHLFILDSDAPVLHGLLEDQVTLTIDPADPVLAGERPRLTVRTEWATDEASPGETAPASNAQTALRSLRTRLLRATLDDCEATAELVVHALRADQLVALFSKKVAAADGERLFALANLLSVLGRVRAGDDLGPGAWAGGEPPRLLEWARYAPTAMSRYPWLRHAYYFAFALLASSGAGARLAYLRSSLRKAPGESDVVLRSLAREIFSGSARPGRRHRSPSEYVHWIEPEAAPLVAPFLPEAAR